MVVMGAGMHAHSVCDCTGSPTANGMNMVPKWQMRWPSTFKLLWWVTMRY